MRISDTDEDSHPQSPGNVFHYQGGPTNPNGGTETSLNSYFTVVYFVNRFLDNRDSMFLTNSKNLGKDISKSDHVFEIERRIGDFASSGLRGLPTDRFDALPMTAFDRRYFAPTLNTEHKEKFAEFDVDDVFDEDINIVPGADTGLDRVVWSMFCRVRDQDGDRKPGRKFHIYFVRRPRNPKRVIFLEETTPRPWKVAGSLTRTTFVKKRESSGQ